jgi:hypothetical protein
MFMDAISSDILSILPLTKWDLLILRAVNCYFAKLIQPTQAPHITRYAAYIGSVSLLKLFDSYGLPSPEIEYAAYAGQLDVINYLCSKNTYSNDIIVYYAIIGGHFQIVEKYEKGTGISYRPLFGSHSLFLNFMINEIGDHSQNLIKLNLISLMPYRISLSALCDNQEIYDYHKKYINMIEIGDDADFDIVCCLIMSGNLDRINQNHNLITILCDEYWIDLGIDTWCAILDDVAITEYLYKQTTGMLLNEVITHKSYNILGWLYNQNGLKTISMFSSNDREMMEWLHEKGRLQICYGTNPSPTYVSFCLDKNLIDFTNEKAQLMLSNYAIKTKNRQLYDMLSPYI